MMRVILVDDHILFRQGLASLLASEPDIAVCGQAGSLKEAIALAHAQKPDVILMDFELPDGTGAEATEAILRDHPACQILFMTVHAEDAKLINAIRSGAAGYLLKTTPIDHLLAALYAVHQGEAAVSPKMTRRLMDELARSGESAADQSDPFGQLTRREIEVLHELMHHATNQEIAAKLVIDVNTVKHHVHSVFGKLAVHNRREAAEYARKHGLK